MVRKNLFCTSQARVTVTMRGLTVQTTCILMSDFHKGRCLVLCPRYMLFLSCSEFGRKNHEVHQVVLVRGKTIKSNSMAVNAKKYIYQ